MGCWEAVEALWPFWSAGACSRFGSQGPLSAAACCRIPLQRRKRGLEIIGASKLASAKVGASSRTPEPDRPDLLPPAGSLFSSFSVILCRVDKRLDVNTLVGEFRGSIVGQDLTGPDRHFLSLRFSVRLS